MGESEIAELCQRIYQKHQRALDLIYEYRPDQQAVQAMIYEVLKGLIQQAPDLLLDSSSKSSIRFVVRSWDVPALLAEKGWGSSGRLLHFYFSNRSDSLKLYLYIGPGPQVIRKRLFDMALSKQSPFRPAGKKLNDQWNTIYNQIFLAARFYKDVDNEEISDEIRNHWKQFVEGDLPQIVAAVQAEQWIWEHPDPLAGAADE